MLEFAKAEIKDYDRIQTYFSLYGENSTQHSFVNLFTLYEKYGGMYCEKDGFLYILRSRQCTDSCRTYLFPMGAGDVRQAVQNILDDAREHHAKVCFRTVTEEKQEFLAREFPELFSVEEVRDYAEYIHLTSNMAELPGNKFKHRRKAPTLRNKYGERLREDYFTKEDIEEVLAFERSWLEASKETHDAIGLNLEYREMELQLAYFDELKISGVIIRIDGVIQGFSYGVPISDDCMDELVQKGNREIRYICQMLEQDFASMCGDGYQYINIEEDLGIEGLRANKLSYKPDILLRKFVVKQN